MEWPLCGLRGFVKRDVLVAMGNEGTDSSLRSVGGCRPDETGGMIGILDDVVAQLR